MTSSNFGAMLQENATTMSSSEQPSSRISLGSSESDVKYDSPNKNSEDLVMNGGDIETLEPRNLHNSAEPRLENYFSKYQDSSDSVIKSSTGKVHYLSCSFYPLCF